MRRAALFVKKTAFNTIRIAFDRERPVFEVRQENRRNPDVIINYIRFGESGFRII